jgi:pyruvate, orthophosphate dikinase
MQVHNGVGMLDSDALKANLLETAGHVEIDPELRLLLEVVANYQGLHSTLEKLLLEVCHPFRNWKMVLPSLRSFALKNSNLYRLHPQGPLAFALFSRLFFEAIRDSLRDPLLLSQAVAAKMVWLDRVLGRFTTADFDRFETELNLVLGRLTELAAQERPVFLHFENRKLLFLFRIMETRVCP